MLLRFSYCGDSGSVHVAIDGSWEIQMAQKHTISGKEF